MRACCGALCVKCPQQSLTVLSARNAAVAETKETIVMMRKSGEVDTASRHTSSLEQVITQTTVAVESNVQNPRPQINPLAHHHALHSLLLHFTLVAIIPLPPKLTEILGVISSQGSIMHRKKKKERKGEVS